MKFINFEFNAIATILLHFQTSLYFQNLYKYYYFFTSHFKFEFNSIIIVVVGVVIQFHFLMKFNFITLSQQY